MKRLFALLLIICTLTTAAQVPNNPTVEKAKQMINRGDYSSAMPLLQLEAKKLNGEALYLIATMYQNGYGVDKDIKHARELATEAGKVGYTKAYRFMGKLDEAEGVWWSAQANYEEMVAKGDPEGWQLIAQLYYDGRGVDRDVTKAFNYFKTAADAGDSWGAMMVSHLYLVGDGTKADENKAFEYARKARWSNSPSLQSFLYLGHFTRCGIGHETNLSEAKTYYSTLLQSEFMEGYTGMGLVELAQNSASSDTTAFRMFLQGAQAKADGKTLGVWTNNMFRPEDCQHYYDIGYRGIIKGNTYDPNFYLGICFRDGRGAPCDWDKAQEYFSSCRGMASVYALEMTMTPQNGQPINFQKAKLMLDEVNKYAREDDDMWQAEYRTLWYYTALFNFNAPAEMNPMESVGWTMMNKSAESGYKKAELYMEGHKKEYHAYLLKNSGFDSFAAWGDAVAKRQWNGMDQGLKDNEVQAMAFECYGYGMDENEAKSFTRAAKCFMDGTGVKADQAKGMELYTKAAEKGDAEACGTLAKIYRKQKRMINAKKFAQQAVAVDKSLETNFADYKELFEVGEEHMGGYVVSVDSTSKHGLVVSKDSMYLDYKDALKWVKTYKGGDHIGWRMPTTAELELMRAVLKEKGMKLTSDLHWGMKICIKAATEPNTTATEISIDELKRKDKNTPHQTFAVCEF